MREGAPQNRFIEGLRWPTMPVVSPSNEQREPAGNSTNSQRHQEIVPKFYWPSAFEGFETGGVARRLRGLAARSASRSFEYSSTSRCFRSSLASPSREQTLDLLAYLGCTACERGRFKADAALHISLRSPVDQPGSEQHARLVGADADPALVIAGIAVREGIEVWKGESCAIP